MNCEQCCRSGPGGRGIIDVSLDNIVINNCLITHISVLTFESYIALNGKKRDTLFFCFETLPDGGTIQQESPSSTTRN